MLPEKKSHGALIAAIVFALLFVATGIFGGWAFSERQSYKNDVDSKISAAVEIAVQEAETAKDVEFTEKEKSPLKTYTGPATYGSISFNFPKTWSIAESTASSSTVLEVVAHPAVLPGFDARQPYALKIQVLSDSYENIVTGLERSAASGQLQIRAFRLEKVPSALGVRVDGELGQGLTGSGVYLPLRDRTLYIANEAPQQLADLENIILPSFIFVP